MSSRSRSSARRAPASADTSAEVVEHADADADGCRVKGCDAEQWIGAICRQHFQEGHTP